MTVKKRINTYNGVKTVILTLPCPFIHSFNSVVLSSFSNSKKAFLCYWHFYNSQCTFGLVPAHVNPTFPAYPQSPTSPSHSWSLNACNSIVCAVVYIYGHHLWLNSSLLSVWLSIESFLSLSTLLALWKIHLCTLKLHLALLKLLLRHIFLQGKQIVTLIVVIWHWIWERNQWKN